MTGGRQRVAAFASLVAAVGFVEVVAAPACDAVPPSAAVAPSTGDVMVEIALGGRSLRVPTAELMRLIRAVEGA